MGLGTNDFFTSNGVIPTTSRFWEQYADQLVTENGITPKLSQMLAEQVFVINDRISTPWTRFIGNPIEVGSSWKEMIMAIPPAKKRNPKATAQDAFGFYDSEAEQEIHQLAVSGWIPITIPDEFDVARMSIQKTGIGEFSAYLQNRMQITYQLTIDSEIGKKFVSSITHADTVDPTDFPAIRKKIRDAATAMRSNRGTYIDSSIDPNKYVTAAPEVLVFIKEELMNDMADATAALPSPERIVTNATLIPVTDMPTPLTTAEWTAGMTNNNWPAGDKPVAADEPQPLAIITSSQKIEARHYLFRQRIKNNYNGAGAFENLHMHWEMSIGLRGWENAMRLNATP